MNVDSNGVILKGYDPVAYFTRHQAVKGNPAIQTRFGGAIYNFVSVADKVAFSKNPSRYVPQYGAFCAYHLSKGELKDSAIQRVPLHSAAKGFPSYFPAVLQLYSYR